jgi:hypothetical protein
MPVRSVYLAIGERVLTCALVGWTCRTGGFSGGLCSDHFAPWSERQGQSGFSFAWPGAALERTSVSFGVDDIDAESVHSAYWPLVGGIEATLRSDEPVRGTVLAGTHRERQGQSVDGAIELRPDEGLHIDLR